MSEVMVHSPSAHTQPGSAKTVADILTAAADMISKPGAWLQKRTATDENGRSCHPAYGVCFCAAGAIIAADSDDMGAYEYFEDHLGQWITSFNDAPERTQAEVVAALRAAAAKARTGAESPSVGTSASECAK